MYRKINKDIKHFAPMSEYDIEVRSRIFLTYCEFCLVRDEYKNGKKLSLHKSALYYQYIQYIIRDELEGKCIYVNF